MKIVLWTSLDKIKMEYKHFFLELSVYIWIHALKLLNFFLDQSTVFVLKRSSMIQYRFDWFSVNSIDLLVMLLT